MQQFITNLKNVGVEDLPSDPMQYVDSTVLEGALNV